MLEDPVPVVRATAVRSLRALLGMVTSFPPSDSNIFLLYIFPALQVTNTAVREVGGEGKVHPSHDTILGSVLSSVTSLVIGLAQAVGLTSSALVHHIIVTIAVITILNQASHTLLFFFLV